MKFCFASQHLPTRVPHLSRPISARFRVPIAWLGAILAWTLSPGTGWAQTHLTIHADAPTGPILHGASGWLYGQAEANVPTENLMAPLQPQIAAQKPPRGLQHPGGDALQVIPSFAAAGGKEMQIYLQDIYTTFYPKPTMESYGAEVRKMVHAIQASPDSKYFVYVPFNEPDGQQYGKYGSEISNLDGFEKDWKTIYRLIRSIDPKARIAGPNFSVYDNKAYADFMAFAKANQVLPDEVTWHELLDTFYTTWYSEYDQFRAIEKGLGLKPIKVVINEYAQGKELGIPGTLVQYIARLEASKVYGCLAYWLPAGSLDGLGAKGLPNAATGAWWLYRWYGGMTGNTLKVTPPDANAKGLQGLATFDGRSRQLKAIFGGASGKIEVAIEGLSDQSYPDGKVHISVWETRSSGSDPSPGPRPVLEGDFPVTDSRSGITLEDAEASSAYYMVLSPLKSEEAMDRGNLQYAGLADLSGTATVRYGGKDLRDHITSVAGYGRSGHAKTEFVLTSELGESDNLILRYASPHGARSLNVFLNGALLERLALPATSLGKPWADATIPMFLSPGINRIAFAAVANGGSEGIALEYLNPNPQMERKPAFDFVSLKDFMLGGSASTQYAHGPVWRQFFGGIGQGAGNFVEFKNIHAPKGGTYRMVVTYSNDEVYNSGPNPGKDPVFRFAEIGVNGGPARRVYFANTFSANTFATTEVDVTLKAGTNTIRFSNSTQSTEPNIESGWAPNIAGIQIWPAQ